MQITALALGQRHRLSGAAKAGGAARPHLQLSPIVVRTSATVARGAPQRGTARSFSTAHDDESFPLVMMMPLVRRVANAVASAAEAAPMASAEPRLDEAMLQLSLNGWPSV